LWLRISKEYTFRGIPQALVLYRIHEGGLLSDGLHMYRDRFKVIFKHFGAPEGEPLTWPREKRRAYGFVYRTGALGHLQSGQFDEAWELLAQAVDIYPELLEYLDTYYELVCGDQTKGFRGQAGLLDIDGNGEKMLRWLDALFASAHPPLDVSLRRKAYSNAFLALAMLNDQAGHWPTARRNLLRSIGARPSILTDSHVTRRLLKLFAGQRMVQFGHRLFGHHTQP
jgi:tetratricopeptide (TPR) repeat protein